MKHPGTINGRHTPTQKSEALAAATAQGFESSTEINQHCGVNGTRRAVRLQTWLINIGPAAALQLSQFAAPLLIAIGSAS